MERQERELRRHPRARVNWLLVIGGGRALTLAVFFILAFAQGSWATTATEQLKSAIDQILATVEAPAVKGDGRAVERRIAVRKIANESFDFTEIARRSLGRHWQPLSEAQHTEFVGLFGDLLERSYISKIELYVGEKIVYSGERVDGDLAIVSTKIMTKNGIEVPIDYRLSRRDDRWMIYDVNIEGISLVSNYRTQFNKIIQSGGYSSLVEKMKTKQTESAEEGARTTKVK
jgi:phospholipid transport system substrate-binding protein